MEEKKYKLARLVNCKGDVSKEWYIVFYIWDNDKKELVRKRDYTINAIPKKKERIKRANQLIEQINAHLISGAYSSKEDAVTEIIESTGSSDTLLDCIKSAIENKEKSLRKNSMRGFTTLQSHLKDFLSASGKSTISLKATNAALIHSFFDYLKTLNLSNRTINNHKGNLSTLFNFYIRREEIDKNPVANVEKLKFAAGKHKPFTDEQMRLIKEDLLQNKEDQFLFFVQCIYFTFFRPGEELRLLRVGDIKEKTIQVPGNIAKNWIGEHVVIPISLEEILHQKGIRKYNPDFFVFGSNDEPGPQCRGMKYFYRKNAALMKRLKLEGKGYDLYGYKHTGVIKLYEATKDIKACQKQCRHSTIHQTDTYLRSLGLITNEAALNFAGF